ncbi:ArsR/SmtB family transcription factor [Acidicapsa dinghuensis]|uniref:ArsR/SmtB family transcription factor n=1 Tax=Acidicapsa dinghuensis TaxID=2218256 RepID=A0ABW1EBL7_9BACT|nr:metalloregulator ArsR/SmtB family transcription factor [Acidicapsa dinghuensis]
MSQPSRKSARKQRHRLVPGPEHAAVFAALGDQTRLVLLSQLMDGEHVSIAGLTEGSGLTRQAITKHLRVLEKSRIVRCTRRGREQLYSLNPKPLMELREYLDLVSRQWDGALMRLKSLVEER